MLTNGRIIFANYLEVRRVKTTCRSGYRACLLYRHPDFLEKAGVFCTRKFESCRCRNFFGNFLAILEILAHGSSGKRSGFPAVRGRPLPMLLIVH